MNSSSSHIIIRKLWHVVASRCAPDYPEDAKRVERGILKMEICEDFPILHSGRKLFNYLCECVCVCACVSVCECLLVGN